MTSSIKNDYMNIPTVNVPPFAVSFEVKSRKDEVTNSYCKYYGLFLSFIR